MKLAFDISCEYLAWVADSDGSFSYNKKYSKERQKNYYVAQFQITWKLTEESQNFFERLVSQFGGSYFIWETRTVYWKTKIVKYCATWEACYKICKYVSWSLLLKKQQALIVLAGASLKSRKWWAKWKPSSVWESELKLYEEIKLLNSKNKWKN